MESKENDNYNGIPFILASITGISGNVITLLFLERDNNFLAMNNSRLNIGNLAVIDLIFSIRTLLIGIGLFDMKMHTNALGCDIILRSLTLQRPLTYLSHALIALHRLQALKSLGSQLQAQQRFLEDGTLLQQRG